MASVRDAFAIAARCSAIPKGRSLNERDGNTEMVFDGKTCRITCGGLFATCVTDLPMESEARHKLRFSIKNETLHSIAQVYDMHDLTISGEFTGMHELNQIKLSSCGVNLSIPISQAWAGYSIVVDDSDYVKVSRSGLSDAFRSIPRLLQDTGEKKSMTAVRVEVRNGRLTIQSADSRLAASIEIPCQSKNLNATLLPVAAMAIVDWVCSNENESVCEIGMYGKEGVVVKCGNSMAMVRQVATNFPDVSRLIKSFSGAESTTLVSLRVLEASMASKSIGCQSMLLKLGERGAVLSSESVDGRVRVEVGGASGDFEIRASPEPMADIARCFIGLGFSDVQLAVSNRALLFTASKHGVSVTSCLAPTVLK